MFEMQVKDDGVTAMLSRVAGGLRNPRPLMRAIAGALETETEKNFANQGRPRWLGLSPRTLKRRGGGRPIILQDTGRLASSISTDYGRDYARIGTNVVYAAIHQFGGVIDRAAHSSWGALRTDRQGNLLRQGVKGRLKNLAVFAKGSHKRVKKIRYTVAAHQINMPARPFLPADQNGQLQRDARLGILREVREYLAGLAKP